MAVSGVKAAGRSQQPSAGGCSTRAVVVVLIVLALALVAVFAAAVARIATLQESLRALTIHKENHRSKAELCEKDLQALQALPSVEPERATAAIPLALAPQAVPGGVPPEELEQTTSAVPLATEPPPVPESVPSGPVSTSEAIFRRSFPRADTAIASCDARPEVGCTGGMCVEISKMTVFAAGTAVQTCTNVCAAFSDCNYFWLYDTGGCCLKSSYDTAKALAPGGIRTGMNGDFYRLTQRGPAPPPYVRPPTDAGTRTDGKYQCSQSSWAGKNPTGTQRTPPRTVRFKDKDSLPSDTLPSMLKAIQATDHDGEERRYVDLGGGQHCVAKDKESLYDIGVLTHFSHALVKMDEIVDCSGKQPCTSVRVQLSSSLAVETLAIVVV